MSRFNTKRKLHTEHLPKRGSLIDWNASLRMDIPFTYDDVDGVLRIIEKRGKDIVIEIDDYGTFDITHPNLIGVKFGKFLNKLHYTYRFDVGEVVGRIKIVSHKTKRLKNRTVRSYGYICIECGNTDEVLEDNIVRGLNNNSQICAVCSNKKIMVGYNDLATTHPYVAGILTDRNDGVKYVKNSNVKLEFTCPNCRTNQIKELSSVVNYGFKCTHCRNSKSYPERFMIGILRQLCIEYEVEKSFLWSLDKKYDFYIPCINTIIEMHGEQHYYESGVFGYTLVQQRLNDALKEQLAIDNGIVNYIVIDSRISEPDFIFKNFTNSKVKDLLNIDEVSMVEAHDYATNSHFLEVCKLWNDGKSRVEISETLSIADKVVRNYLVLAQQSNIVEYSVDEAKIRKSNYIKLLEE